MSPCQIAWPVASFLLGSLIAQVIIRRDIVRRKDREIADLRRINAEYRGGAMELHHEKEIERYRKLVAEQKTELEMLRPIRWNAKRLLESVLPLVEQENYAQQVNNEEPQ
jgi:hypothetical protein